LANIVHLFLIEARVRRIEGRYQGHFLSERRLELEVKKLHNKIKNY
jgi:hypothetical protein